MRAVALIELAGSAEKEAAVSAGLGVLLEAGWARAIWAALTRKQLLCLLVAEAACVLLLACLHISIHHKAEAPGKYSRPQYLYSVFCILLPDWQFNLGCASLLMTACCGLLAELYCNTMLSICKIRLHFHK